MRSALRSAGVVLLGFVVAVIVLVAAEVVNSKIFPLPAGIDPTNMEALKQVVANLPARAFVLVVMGWAVATFCGAWLAARLASRVQAVHGGVVTVMLIVAGILNMLDLPHPTWVWIAGLAAFVIGGVVGTRIGADRSGSNPRPSNAQVAPAGA